MDRTVSFTSSFKVFAAQSYACLLFFNKIRALPDWSLNTSTFKEIFQELFFDFFLQVLPRRNDLPMQVRHIV